MKKTYLLLEFALVFLLLALPPMLVRPQPGGPQVGAPAFLQAAAQLLIVLALDARHRAGRRAHGPDAAEAFRRRVAALSWGATTLGLLMLAWALVTALALLLPGTPAGAALDVPRGAGGWVLLAAGLGASACYEEAVYRQSLPEALLALAEGRRRLKAAAEALCLLAFALGHRYLGWAAVANAMLGGAALRLCRLRTGGIYAGAAAHFLYNLALFLFGAAG